MSVNVSTIFTFPEIQAYWKKVPIKPPAMYRIATSSSKFIVQNLANIWVGACGEQAKMCCSYKNTLIFIGTPGFCYTLKKRTWGILLIKQNPQTSMSKFSWITISLLWNLKCVSLPCPNNTSCLILKFCQRRTAREEDPSSSLISIALSLSHPFKERNRKSLLSTKQKFDAFSVPKWRK